MEERQKMMRQRSRELIGGTATCNLNDSTSRSSDVCTPFFSTPYAGTGAGGVIPPEDTHMDDMDDSVVVQSVTTRQKTAAKATNEGTRVASPAYTTSYTY